MSNSAFYAHFTHKEECFVAVYDEVATAIDAVFADADFSRPWVEVIDGLLQSYLAVLDADRDRAVVFVVESRGDVPDQVRQHRLQTVEHVIDQMRQVHERFRDRIPRLGALDDRELRGMLEGLVGIVAHALVHDPVAPLSDLAGSLSRYVTGLVLGVGIYDDLTADPVSGRDDPAERGSVRDPRAN